MVTASHEPLVLARSTGPVPKVSVAVSTRNRSHLLPRLVACLERQTLPRDVFEVVIVDDASTDATPEVLEELASSSSIAVAAARLVVQTGPAAGRNAAWRLARGEIVAFTDDDCQPTPSWLEQGIAALEAGAGIVVGRVAPDPDQLRHLGPFGRTVRVEDVSYLATCNIFYRREDLEAVRGFDEGFPPRAAGGEDTDLGWRVRDGLGRRIEFVREALVLHDVRPSRFGSKVKETLRWTGIARLVALHPADGRRMLHRRIFWKATHPRVLLAAAGLLLALRFRPAALLVIPWLRIRMDGGWTPGAPLERITALPGAMAIDLLEVAVMLRGSIENKTLVL